MYYSCSKHLSYRLPVNTGLRLPPLMKNRFFRAGICRCCTPTLILQDGKYDPTEVVVGSYAKWTCHVVNNGQAAPRG